LGEVGCQKHELETRPGSSHYHCIAMTQFYTFAPADSTHTSPADDRPAHAPAVYKKKPAVTVPDGEMDS
jgi:hypothetical protein